MVKVHGAQKVDRTHGADKKTSHCKSRAFSPEPPTENSKYTKCSGIIKL